MMESLLFYILIPTLLIMGGVYWKTRKLFPLIYCLSGLSYVIGIVYAISSFDIGKGGIVGILAVSGFLMMLIGYYLSQEENRET